MEIGNKLKMKKNLFSNRYKFWDKVYEKYYWNPTPVEAPKKVESKVKNIKTDNK